MQYQINPNTAARVYSEMELMNLSFTKRGIGTFVTEDETKIAAMKQDLTKKLIEDFYDQMKGLGYSEKEIKDLL